MSFCQKCGAQLTEGSKFCTNCGALVTAQPQPVAPPPHPHLTPPYLAEVFVVTTPTVPGYRISRVLGIVTGMSARTRGVGGKFVAGIQSMVGGEVSAFTYEIEKAKSEALQRVKEQARQMGANAVIGLDMESSDLQGIIIISASGTAVIIEPEPST